MNIYMYIIRSTVKKLNVIALSFFLLPFISVTYYKIFHVGNRNFLELDDPSISWTILVPVFILVLLQNYATPLIILYESSKDSINKMVPRLRKVKLIFSGSYMLLTMIWSIYILGSYDPFEICAFVMFTLWFISLMTAGIFGFRFMYRSSRYNFLKVLFYFLHSVIAGFYLLLEYQVINSIFPVLIFYVLFISTAIYQIFNFYKNYSNYKEDYERNYKEGWKKILGGDFFGHLEYSTKNRSIKKLITRFKQTKSKYTQAKLFQYSLNTYNSNRVMILTAIIGWAFYYVVIAIVGVKYGMFLVFYFYIYSAFSSINLFRQKELVQHLYLTSGLKRKRFEWTILLSYIMFFIKDSIFDVCSVTIIYFTYKHFYPNLTITPIVLLFLISFIARSSIIYGCWVVTLKNKDYGDLDKKRFLIY